MSTDQTHDTGRLSAVDQPRPPVDDRDEAAVRAAGATGSPAPDVQVTTVARRRRGRGGTRSRRVLYLVGAALLGSAVALTGNLVQGARYTSESAVLWDPSSAQLVDQTVSVDPNLLDRQVTDQQDVIDSDAVIGAAGKVLDMDATDLRKAISTSVTQGSSLITISATSDDPAEAQRIATAVTEAYVANLKSTGAASLNNRADALQSTIDRQNAQLATLTAQLSAQTGQLAGVPQTSSTFAVLQGQVTQLSGQVSELTTRVSDLADQQEGLRADAQIYPGAAYVLQEADEPDAPSSFSVPVTIALGAALGLLVAGCVLGIQVLRRRNETPAAGE